MLDVTFAAPALPAKGALVLLVAEGAAPAGLWKAADEATGGAVGRAFAAAEFTGKEGQTCTILAPGAGLSRILAVGLGKEDSLSERRLEDAGGALAAALSREPSAALAADGLTGAQAVQVALGAALRSYRFDLYHTKIKPEDRVKFAALSVLTGAADAAAAWPNQAALVRGVFITRDLATEPANVLTPVEMANRIEKLRDLGLDVEVVGPEKMAELGFGALLGVAQGSVNPARMVIMRWNGGKNGDKPLAFIGKGVTFDTGGISIKPAAGMEDMKWDMAGAAAVTGLMAALAGRRAAVNVVGLVGLVENMPSGTAQRPGDVVHSYSGQTVEVLNTDAEGRLVLADVLWYCQQKFDPRFMVDLATLTGAIIVALGHEHAGVFSNDDDLAGKLLAAGLATGEKLWRLPMGREYDKLLKSDIADMKNITGRPGGSITAAQFLARFVNEKPWAHLDIAGTAWATKDHPTWPKGATGFGVRLLNRLVADHFEAG
ncbi:MAG: leucyl aminopeptidase [Rhodospirillales bacterium]